MAHRWKTLFGVLIVNIFIMMTCASLAKTNEENNYHGRAGYLRLSGNGVNFGAIRKDPSDPNRRRTYFEAANAIPVTYRTYRWVIDQYGVNWEVRISGDNLNCAGDSIPITQLRWKTPGGNYRNMPAQGDWDILDKSSNYKTIDEQSAEHSIPISLYLPLTNDEYGGTYQGTFYASLIFY